MPKNDTSSTPPLRSGISRRRVVGVGLRAGLGIGVGAISAPAVLRVIPASAQSRVIKIGHVSPKTGPLAGFGEADEGRKPASSGDDGIGVAFAFADDQRLQQAV